MKKIVKPSIAELDALKIRATKNGEQTLEEWQIKMLKGYAGILERNPKQYRSFGIFWWGLKQAIINADIHIFGEHIDVEALEATDYNNAVYNIFAAYLYAEHTTDHGLMYSHDHQYTTLDSFEEGEVVMYTLIDEDMEQRVMQLL